MTDDAKQDNPRPESKRPFLSLNVDLEDASQHPDKIAASVAVAFYKELKRYNFSNNQIINVATELIDCLNRSLEGYKKKMGKDQD